MGSQKPKISIGMPIYNDASFIKESIPVLLNQTFHDFELIIADNASSDETKDICTKLAETDDRIRYFRHIDNIGAKANFRFVLNQAKANYFMWAAADDSWEPNYIESLYSAITSNNNIGLSFCPHFWIDKNGERIGPLKSFNFSSQGKILRLLKFINIYDDVCIYGLFKAGLLKSLRFPTWWGFNAKSPYNTAYPVLIEMLSQSNFAFSTQTLFYSRIRHKSIISHYVPFKNPSLLTYIAMVIRRFNVLVESFISIKRGAKSISLAVIFLPVLFLRFVVDCFVPKIFFMNKVRRYFGLENN